MTNYRRGAETEYKIKSQLESEGYYVMRSSGSKGSIDLIALKYFENMTEIICIQVKRTKSKITDSSYKKDIEGLKCFAETFAGQNCKVQLWVWKDREGFSVFEINAK